MRRAGDAVQAQDELKALNDALRELEQIRAELERLKAAGALGRGSWWSGLVIGGPLPPGAEVTDGELERRQLPILVRNLRELTRKAQKSILEAWRNHVNSYFGAAADLGELVDLMAGEGRLAQAATDLKRALGSLPSLTTRIPDAASVRALADTVALSEAFEAALPSTVRAFITAAARGGAPVTMLNADVMQWLHDNDAVGNFKVTAGNPSGVARG
ncbi:hypothetical protein ALI22I_33430 [Saccharothrix sp. ALI-22-I]|uniref:hypothetical protein n=1 Tax=Saccharothrix sp. ALI-22-I TaxID=1933778 RepID=UPI00097C0604|nr:hypothetical protein [Saccharothrix sp. ALI-22-I]ONI83418.1 hypothetical protein ALI22I_33430 [Saccharothrix sp. ALI-22-I]